MAGHGVTLPQYVAIARHAGSPCPRIPLILVSIPIWLPRNDPWPALRSTTYIVRCSPQTSSRHHQGTWAAELWAERQGFGPPIECQQRTRDLAGVTSELVCFVRSSARKNPVSFSSRFPLSVFTGTRLGHAPLGRAKPTGTASRYSTRWAVFNPAYSESPKGPRSLGKWQDARGMACNGS